MPVAREIYQEGLIIPPVRLVRQGQIDSDMLELILANVRTPEERAGDLWAQIAANRRGAERLAGDGRALRAGTRSRNIWMRCWPIPSA